MLEIKKFKPSNHLLKTMIYGVSGSGKTTLASTAPKPLYICSENGLASIADKKPEYVEISTIDELKTIYNELKKGIDYESIVIDSLSEIGKVIKENLTKSNQFDMNMRKRGQYADEMMQIVRDIIKLPYHIVCIIHDKQFTDEEGKLEKYGIAIQGGAKDEVPRYFDVIAYTYIKEGKHLATCKPNEKLITKDRLNCLPDPLPNNISERIDIFKKNVEIGTSEVIKELKEDKLLKQKKAIKKAINEGETKKLWKEKIEQSDKLSGDDKKELLDFISNIKK